MPSIKIRKMQTAPLKLIEIQRDLPLLSERKLGEVKDFVGFMLN